MDLSDRSPAAVVRHVAHRIAQSEPALSAHLLAAATSCDALERPPAADPLPEFSGETAETPRGALLLLRLLDIEVRSASLAYEAALDGCGTAARRRDAVARVARLASHIAGTAQ